MCVVGTEVAFSELEQFCCKNPQGLYSVMTVDPTLNFGEFYFTPITFKKPCCPPKADWAAQN